MTATRQLAAFVASVDYAALPVEGIERAKLLILDSLGISIAGVTSPVGQIVVTLGWESGEGTDATVIGTEYSTSIASAAFINGTLAHALDMDDTAANTGAHPSAAIVPALLALAEKHHISGRSFLAAYILGLEVFYRIALASDGQMGGWHRTSVFGTVAAAAACARLLNLPAEQIATAISVSTSLTGGVQVNFGTMTKAIQVGNASRGGVLAALLARAGCTAHEDALGDGRGFGLAFYAGQFNTEKLVSDLGRPYSIVFPGIALKKYPCCGLTHSPADLVLALVRSHELAAEQIESIVVFAEELLPSVLTYHRPRTGYEGKYSLEYVVAAAIIDRQITAASFTDDMVNRPQIQAYLEKTQCFVRPDSEWGRLRVHSWGHPAEVTIRLKDGRSFSQQAPCARGYPELPLSTEEVLDKFRTCAQSMLPAEAVGELATRVLALETQSDMSAVIALTRPRRQ